MTAQIPGRGRTGGVRRILCPTDFSAVADAGVDRAVSLATREGAELVLLHVLAPITAYVVPDVAGSVLVEVESRAREDARGELRRLRDRVRRTGVQTHAALVQGSTPLQIARAAERLHCDLIVLATHGRTGLTRMLLGSVAEGVVRRAPCPVLTFRPPQLALPHGQTEGELKVAA
jgi:nucleotide-binding universal stress UspA family protein